MSKRAPHPIRFFLTIVLLISYPLLASASDDWVLEKRFQEQLDQAQTGNTQAMFEVGRMYERGRGTDEDVDKALDWYQKAAKGGSDSAHARLGMIYFTGHGAEQDYVKANSHLWIAAKNNHPAAQFYLAMMFEKGRVVKKNYATALSLYKKSAAGGYYQASARIKKIQKLLAASRTKTVKLPSPPIAPKQAKKKLANDLVQSILQGDWHRNGKPAGYLPSTGTKCKKNGHKSYKCRSPTLQRKSDDTLITYVTMATLSGFNKTDKFDITYQYNILRLQKEGEEEPKQDDEDDDGDYSAAPTQSHGILKLGAQHTKHRLNCTLKDERTLSCIKNRAHKIEFNNISGS